MVKDQDDTEGTNIIPAADGRRNRFNLPLILIDYDVGNELIESAEKKQDVLLSVDFDAVNFLYLVSTS